MADPDGGADQLPGADPAVRLRRVAELHTRRDGREHDGQAGARQMPATTRASASDQNSHAKIASDRADEDHEHAASERPRTDRQVAECEPAHERRDRPDREHEPGVRAALAERCDHADLDRRTRPDDQEAHDRRDQDRGPEHDRPNRRLLRGMRTRPTSGDITNQAPPPTRNTTDSRTPAIVETWVPTNVTTTGPAIQMISCAEASSEKSGVSWREFTIFG